MAISSRIVSTLLLSVALIGPAVAGTLDSLSNAEAGNGLRAALSKGAESAVGKLGVENGFLNNDKVKINLPSSLDKAQRLLRMTGQGPKLDELVVSMNHAAEQAVPLAKPLLSNAIKSMTVSDAKQILTGGETSVTDFFRQKTAVQLKEQFMPTVKSVTDRVGLAESYNRIMGPIAEHGAVAPEEASVEAYVTDRAVDGLFLMIAEEEKAIRQDPVGTGSKIIGKVFGLLK